MQSVFISNNFLELHSGQIYVVLCKTKEVGPLSNYKCSDDISLYHLRSTSISNISHLYLSLADGYLFIFIADVKENKFGKF